MATATASVTVMRVMGILFGAVAVVAFSGCSSDSAETKVPRETVATPAAVETTTATELPAPEKTYIPAPGDPKSHVFDVMIHDVLPLDAYRTAGGQCLTTSVPDFPHKLTFIGPSRHLESRPLDKDFAIPETARLLTDGSCESQITVTVPYKPRYTAGIAMEGHGMPAPTDPGDTKIVTKGNSQAITVLR